MNDDLKTEVAVQGNRISTLETSDKLQWETFNKVKENLTAVRIQLAAYGVVNTLIIAWAIYKITKGA